MHSSNFLSNHYAGLDPRVAGAVNGLQHICDLIVQAYRDVESRLNDGLDELDIDGNRIQRLYFNMASQFRGIAAQLAKNNIEVIADQQIGRAHV